MESVFMLLRLPRPLLNVMNNNETTNAIIPSTAKK